MGAHSSQIPDFYLFGEPVFNIIPFGTPDGSTFNFVLPNNPTNNTVQVYLNGVLQNPGSGKDYQITGSTIIFSKAPRAGSEVLVHYLKP